jgi:hypothetical protein
MAKIIRTACWARLIACVAIFLGSLPSEGESVVLADDFSTGIQTS